MKKIILFILVVLFILESVSANASITSSYIINLSKKHAANDINVFFPTLSGLILNIFGPIYYYLFYDPIVPNERISQVKRMLPEDQQYLLKLYIYHYKAEAKRLVIVDSGTGALIQSMLLPFFIGIWDGDISN